MMHLREKQREVRDRAASTTVLATDPSIAFYPKLALVKYSYPRPVSWVGFNLLAHTLLVT